MNAQPPEPQRPPPRWWEQPFDLKHSLWGCTAALPVLVALAALTAPAYSFSAPNPIYNLLLYAFCLDLIVVIVLAFKVWGHRRRSGRPRRQTERGHGDGARAADRPRRG